MKWDVFNIKGQVVKSVELPESIYSVDMNEAVLHSAVKAYQANRRQGTHATKTKSMVSGGGKKPFKQKGTGGARQGSSRSPLMPGGGTAHGPQPRDYRQKLSANVKQLALKVALSDKVRHHKLIVVEGFEAKSYSTKHVVQILKNLKCDESALLADQRNDDFLHRSASNVMYVDALAPTDMNAEDVVRHRTLIVSVDALKSLEQRLGAAV